MDSTANYVGAGQYSAAAFTINTTGYVCTGEDSNAYQTNELWAYSPLLNQWTKKANYLGSKREGATAFVIGNRGFVGTGTDTAFNINKDFWEYNPITDSWLRILDYGGTTGIYAAAGFSCGNSGYVATGYDAFYNPLTALWKFSFDSTKCLQPRFTSISQTIYNGQSFNFNGTILTNPGLYYDTLLTFLGCDSLVTLNLYVIYSSNLCAQNIGFEQNNLSNWTSYIGTNDSVHNNVFHFTQTTPIINRQAITPSQFNGSSANGLDPYGNFPVICPLSKSGSYSLKLGNDLIYDSCERVQMKIQIPAASSSYPLSFYYATVQNDAGALSHGATISPMFRADIIDSITGLPIDSFISNYANNNAGYQTSTVLSWFGSDTVYFKPWSGYTFNINNKNGKTIYLNFTTSDCTNGGHFGYAYIDVPTHCALPLITQHYCSGDTVALLIAPNGYTTYNWYDSSFTNLLGTTDTINAINASNNQLIKLIASNGSSTDTLQVRLAAIPKSFKTLSATICNHHSYLFGGKYFNATGTYADTLTNFLGCDSIITLQLVVDTTCKFRVNAGADISLCPTDGGITSTSIVFPNTIAVTNGIGSRNSYSLYIDAVNRFSSSAETFRDFDSTIAAGGYFLTHSSSYVATHWGDSINIIVTVIDSMGYMTSDTVLARIQPNKFCNQTLHNDYVTTSKNKPLLINLTANDVNVPLTISASPLYFDFPAPPMNGWMGTSSFDTTAVYLQYYPHQNYVGTDSFFYVANDSDAFVYNIQGLKKDTAWVHITVNPTPHLSGNNQTLCNGNSATIGTLTCNDIQPTTHYGGGIENLYTQTPNGYRWYQNTIGNPVINAISLNCNGQLQVSPIITTLYISAYDLLNQNVTIYDSVWVFVNSSFDTIYKTACNNYFFHHQTLTQSGVYYDTLTNYLGCDSFITLHLNLKSSSSAFTQTICSNNSYFFNGNFLNSSGTYYDTLINAAGCDSIVTLHLKVNNPTTSTIIGGICNGNSYNFHGKILNVAGTYYDTIQNYHHCDSIIKLNLKVGSPSAHTIHQSICAGGSVVFNGHTITTAGIYKDTLVNHLGCDSMLTLNLTIGTASSHTFNTNICSGSSVLFNGHLLGLPGLYYDTLVNYMGCDSFLTMNLIVNYPSVSNTNATICLGTTYVWNGNTYSNAGSYTIHLNNYVGCDSAATLNLVTGSPVTPTFSIAALQTAICQGDPVNLLFNYINGGTTPTFVIKVNGNILNTLSGALLGTTINGLINGDVITVTFTSNAPCVTTSSITSKPITISVLQKINPTVSITANPGTMINYGANMSFTATITNGGIAPVYDFYVNNKIAQSSLNNIYVTDSIRNNDQVYCILNGNYSCIASTNIVHSNTITMNVIGGSTGVENIAIAEQMNIVPNPCSTCEVVINTAVATGNLIITDLLGRTITAQFEKTAKGYLINLPNASAGVYFIRNNKTGQVVKFVKE